MKKLLTIGLTLVGVICFNQTYATRSQSPWSMLTFIQANNDLTEYAMYSIGQMEAGMQKPKGVNVLVHWDDPASGTIRRYKIVPGEMETCGTLPKAQRADPALALVEAVQWMVTSYPANHYMIILWNHGSGVVDDSGYRSPMSPTFFKDLRFKVPHVRPQLINVLNLDRSILFDDTYKRVLTNQGLVDAMTKIKEIVGKKIDVVVMDACYMGMYEICYDLRDSVQYLVASQEAESGGGLPYGFFLYPLTLQPEAYDPLGLAQTIVYSYKLFYHVKEGFEDYTYAAIDLVKGTQIKANVDEILTKVDVCVDLDAAQTKKIIKAARGAAHEMWWNIYIDLYSFYDEWCKQIDLALKNPNQSSEYVKALGALRGLLVDGKNLVQTAVVANAVGSVHAPCKGMSIYYPVKEPFHPSYKTTQFAQDSRWERFIITYC